MSRTQAATVAAIATLMLAGYASTQSGAVAQDADQPTESSDRPGDAAGQAPAGDAEAADASPALPYTELPIGSTVEARVSSATPANFSFASQTPGLLTVVVRGRGESADLMLQLFDDEGNSLAESDIDFAGHAGAEQFCAVIPVAGRYRVVVNSYGNSGEFWIGGSWIAHEGVAGAALAKVSEATELTPGTPQMCTINGNNPPNAWFKYTAERPGLVMLEINAKNQADLYLELFDEKTGFTEAVQYVDNDLRGDLSSESISVEVEQGQTVYFRINAHELGLQTEVNVVTKLFVQQGSDE